MPLITIGEYADKATSQRDFIRETEVDLASGAGSLLLSSRTCSIRACADVTHRFQLRKDAKATAASQRRPANVSEALEVMPGQNWSISVVTEDDFGGGSGLAAILDLLGNKAKYEKAFKAFTDAKTASEAAAKDARLKLEASQAAAADLAEREKALSTQTDRVKAREEAVAAREAKVAKDAAEHRAEAKRTSDALSAREDAIKPREKALAESEAALHSRVAALTEAEGKLASAKADVNARYAAMAKLVTPESSNANA